MEHLLLKLLVTPLLVGAASLAGRRWGPMVSGWLVALPLTSGPIVFFISLSQGATFARMVAIATLAGALSQIVFCLCYAWLAGRRRWPVAVLLSSGGFAVTTMLIEPLSLSPPLLSLLVVAGLALAIRWMPRVITPQTANPRPLPRWDIPARMILTTTLVLILTGSATILGARMTGLLAPFPVYGAILAVFAQHLDGPPAAVLVLRGLLFGLFSFTGFFLALVMLLTHLPIGLAFAAAIVIALACQAGTLWVIERIDRTAPN